MQMTNDEELKELRRIVERNDKLCYALLIIYFGLIMIFILAMGVILIGIY